MRHGCEYDRHQHAKPLEFGEQHGLRLLGGGQIAMSGGFQGAGDGQEFLTEWAGTMGEEHRYDGLVVRQTSREATDCRSVVAQTDVFLGMSVGQRDATGCKCRSR